MKLLHTCLRISNLEASLKFYQQALGLVESHRIDHTEYGFILVYLTDDEKSYEIELTYNLPSETYDLGNGFSHIALETKDLEATWQQHQDLGYEVTPLKGLPGSKPTYFFVKDPDGYMIEIIQAK